MNKFVKFAAACAAVLCAFGAGAALLPVEYQEVEYIQSDGSQVIDTEVVINENHELRFKYAMLQIDAYRGPFGSYVSENNNATRVMSNNGSTTDLLVNFMTKAGGGGGRISVMVRANADQIAKLYATGALTGGEVANLADLSDWEGHFDVAGGIGGDNKDSGEPGTAVFVTAPTGFSLIVR